MDESKMPSTALPPQPRVPETRVLAVASHVVYGYVGNTMAAFVMQSLGFEVAALNTVQFSNHSGYKQFKGTRTSALEISNLFQGLQNSHLDKFDMMLTGYAPSAAAVEAIGRIAQSLKLKATMKPGSFFWVLDPVMGDNGKLYVAEDVVPAYTSLVQHADLVLPNQYEAEWLSGVKIVDMHTLTKAIAAFHVKYRVPHIIITSVKLPAPASAPSLFVIGSTISSTSKPRVFKIEVPAIDGYFSGTGDMFAALMAVRLREAVSMVPGLSEVTAWVSEDGVEPTDLPLARAAEKVLASMQEALIRTKRSRDEELELYQQKVKTRGSDLQEDDQESHLRVTKASEVRLVRNMEHIRNPQLKFYAEKEFEQDCALVAENRFDYASRRVCDDLLKVKRTFSRIN